MQVKVPDRSAFTTEAAETRLVTPTGLQAKIDAAVKGFQQGACLPATKGTDCNLCNPSCLFKVGSKDDDGFMHAGRSFVRPSGTEDVVRVYAEAASRGEADQLAGQIVALVEQAG